MLSRINCKAIIFFIAFLPFHLLYAQWIPDDINKSIITERMFSIVEVLASDSLGGREAGTIYEKKARDYIISKFEAIGLQAFYDNSYSKPFFILDKNTIDEHSYLIIDQDTLLYDKDYEVLSDYNMSSLPKTEIIDVRNGLYLPDQNVNDYKSLTHSGLKANVFLIDVSYPEKIKNKLTETYIQTLRKSIIIASNKGASAILLYHSNPNDTLISKNVFFNLPIKMTRVFYLTDVNKNYLKYKSQSITFIPKNKQIECYNIAAFIDNDAPATLVIGAHYDHEGIKTANTSIFDEEVNIYYGADDNASGVAMMLELAQFVKKQELNKHNYLFIAFGAEEKGLIGSREFVNDKECFPNNIMAMINLDMIGRLDETHRKMEIYGAGSANEWDSLISINYNPDINIVPKQGISYNSDHANFYKKRIPVLFFHTGLHKDYHKPSDTADKINKDGMYDIYLFISNLILNIENTETITLKSASRRH